MATWVLPWRQRLIQREDRHKQEQRSVIGQTIANLKKKQLRLGQIIQRHVNINFLLFHSHRVN